jgi:hypothetical protein
MLIHSKTLIDFQYFLLLIEDKLSYGLKKL